MCLQQDWPFGLRTAEEAALEIHTNVPDLIIIKFICMVMCFKWSLLPTNKARNWAWVWVGCEDGESGLRNEKCQYPCANESLELLDRVSGLETGSATAGSQALGRVSAKFTTTATPTFQCVWYRYVMCLSELFVICCAAGRTKWPKGCSPGSRRRILHSGPLQSNDESSNFYKN